LYNVHKKEQKSTKIDGFAVCFLLNGIKHVIKIKIFFIMESEQVQFVKKATNRCFK